LRDRNIKMVAAVHRFSLKALSWMLFGKSFITGR
jgi:hypothetical protein